MARSVEEESDKRDRERLENNLEKSKKKKGKVYLLLHQRVVLIL